MFAMIWANCYKSRRIRDEMERAEEVGKKYGRVRFVGHFGEEACGKHNPWKLYF